RGGRRADRRRGRADIEQGGRPRRGPVAPRSGAGVLGQGPPAVRPGVRRPRGAGAGQAARPADAAQPQPRIGPEAPLGRRAQDGRYVGVAAPQYSPGAEKQFPASPVKVLNLTTFKEVVATEWRVGASAFTADSTRVLLFDETGAARWFKLTDGNSDAKPDAKP